VELPRRARRWAGQVRFIERVEPPDERAEDLDSGRLVTRFQAGDRETFSVLYVRYFDRVYNYLKMLLRDRHEAEDAAQEVFTDALASLPDFELRGHPFKAWLFTIARHRAIAILRRSGRLEPMSPEEIEEQIERTQEIGQESIALNWIRDPDLAILMERLPQPQRQVLAMRYLLDMRAEEIAETLELTPNHVAVLQYRALDFLRKRLEALGRTPERRTKDQTMKAPLKHNRVARNRRYSL
jgi:RNA polymerase sigma-70 factor (ECF subfamily)